MSWKKFQSSEEAHEATDTFAFRDGLLRHTVQQKKLFKSPAWQVTASTF